MDCISFPVAVHSYVDSSNLAGQIYIKFCIGGPYGKY
jgi:hypothetical protein